MGKTTKASKLAQQMHAARYHTSDGNNPSLLDVKFEFYVHILVVMVSYFVYLINY
jgi:hypothetical protein